MSQYYFLAASLPFLSYDSDHAPTPEEFRAAATEHLSRSDLAVLAGANIDAPVEIQPGHSLVTTWQRFERGLRNELVKVRAAKRGTDPGEYIRADAAGRDETDLPGLSEVSREAFGEESPLSGEDVLARFRWSFLTDLEVGHFFDLDFLVIYYLKLQILARKRQFTSEDGERVFRAVSQKIMNDYYQEQGDV